MAYTKEDLVRDFNRYSIMNITDIKFWRTGREYSIETTNDTCAKKDEAKCETKQEGEKYCKLLTRKNGSKKCREVENTRIFDHEHEHEFTNTNFDGKAETYKLKYTDKYDSTSKLLLDMPSDRFFQPLVILEHPDFYLVLFGFGDDYECKFDQEGKQTEEAKQSKEQLNKIIEIIKDCCKDETKEIHLYGHSQGSTTIRYLLHFDEFTTLLKEFKKTVIRLSGTRVYKPKVEDESRISFITDYKSLNLAYQLKGSEDLYIDRFGEGPNIEEQFKEHTIIGKIEGNKVKESDEPPPLPPKPGELPPPRQKASEIFENISLETLKGIPTEKSNDSDYYGGDTEMPDLHDLGDGIFKFIKTAVEKIKRKGEVRGVRRPASKLLLAAKSARASLSALGRKSRKGQKKNKKNGKNGKNGKKTGKKRRKHKASKHRRRV